MQLNRQFAAAFVAGISLAAAADAAFADSTVRHETIAAAEASTTDLGNGASALTYWIDGADGRHVVTTVDFATSENGQDRHQLVRFSAVLQSGQAQLVSVPTAQGAVPATLKIERVGDRIEVTRATAAPQVAGNLD
jgi:hypothetical protein